MLPPVAGAVAVIVNSAVPLALPDGKPAVSVSVHVSVAPAALGSAPQLTTLTPAPGATAVATTPAGNLSDTVALVPLAVPPLLPRPIVYVIDPFVSTVAGPLLLRVMFAGAFTVSPALPVLPVPPFVEDTVPVVFV